MTCYRVGTMKSLPGIRTYVAVDGGMMTIPRPVLYGSGQRRSCPPEVGQTVLLLSASSASTVNRATFW